jgi:hypothetical protein
MKKTLLGLVAVSLGSALSAQITITQGDIAPYYFSVLQNNDTMPTVTPGMPGTNQTYNLTALNAHTTDTFDFTDPNFTPNGSAFPGSNEAAIINTNQAYVYFNVSSTAFQITGQAADPIGNGIVNIPYSDWEKVLNFPCTYNSAFMDTAKGEGWTYLGYDPGIGFQVDSVHIHTTVYKNSIVDGWGQATTPLGTYNVIRVNALRHQIDTVDIQAFNAWIPNAFIQDDSTRTYTYWANGIGFPLAELSDHQDLNTITSATWIPAMPQMIGMNEYADAANMNVFPNPSVETVNFMTNGSKVAVIHIMNANGQLVRSANVVSDKTSVNVSDLAPGIYFYQATDANGTVLEKGKISVHH